MLHDVCTMYCVNVFQPMTMIQQNGPGFQYTLIINRQGDMGRPKTITIDDWRIGRHEEPIGAGGAYLPFEVWLKASNNQGDSSGSLVKHILHSGEDSKLNNCS